MTPKPGALQFSDDLAQPLILILDAGELRGVCRSFGQQQVTQLFGVGGKVLHGFRYGTAPDRHGSRLCKADSRESLCRSSLRGFRNPRLDHAHAGPLHTFDQCRELRRSTWEDCAETDSPGTDDEIVLA